MRSLSVFVCVGSVAGTALAASAAGRLPPAGEEVWPYAVNRGDTLIAIADNYLAPHATWRHLQQKNAVADPRRLPVGSTVRIPVAWLRSEATVAEIVYARGDVQVQPPGAPAPGPVSSGQTLPAGTLLRTGEQASMVLRLADGTRLMLAPNTRARLDELLAYGRTRLHRAAIGLEQGSIESQVTPSGTTVQPYRIRTPVATLGVRGTEFRAHAAPARAGVEVLTGAVAAAAGPPVVVDAGFGTFASASGVAPPQVLLPPPALPMPPPSPEDRPFEARWPAVAGASAYRAQVFAAGDGSLWRDGRFEAPAATWTDLPAGAWRLRVRALDRFAIEGRDAEVAFERTAPLPPPPPPVPPPRLGTPRAGATVEGGSAAFTWYAVESGRRYRLQVAADAGFQQLRADETDAAPPPFALVQRAVALPPGRYHWRVAALADDGRPGPFSPAQPFEVRPATP